MKDPKKAAERQRRYRERHYEEICERQRIARRVRYYANHEQELEKRRKLREDPAFRAEAARRSREWREKNPERFAEGRALWRERNWQKVLEGNSRRRAAMRTSQVEPIDRLALYERDGGRCHICRRKVSREKFSLDHLIPLARGGPHTADNLRVAHLRCNLQMGVARKPAQLLLALKG